jgi:hypothetical protein
LITLNHKRLQVPSRKSKGSVINSVLDQLTKAECRFLKRATNEDRPADTASTTRKEKCWVALSQSESRAKISHAFRDKRHDPDVFLFLKHIQERIVVPNRCQGLSRDAVFEAVNAKILATSLEGSEADHHIKYLLMRVVESELWLILTNHCFCKCSMISDRGQEVDSRCGLTTFENNSLAMSRTDNLTKIKVDSLEASQRLSLMSPFPSIPYPSRMIDFYSEKTSKSGQNVDPWPTTPMFGTNAMTANITDYFTKIHVDSTGPSRQRTLMNPFPTIPFPLWYRNNIELVSSDLKSSGQIDISNSIDIYCD